MFHVYACGFNGFGQIQQMEFSLKPCWNTTTKGCEMSHKDTLEPKMSLETEPCPKLKEDRHDYSHVGTGSCKFLISKKKTAKHSKNYSDLARKRKMTEETTDCVKRSFSNHSNTVIFGLRNIGSFPIGVQIQHVEMTWARCAVTLSNQTELDSSLHHHTVVCGYEGALKQTSESLHLHLPDCEIKATDGTNMLLQKKDELLLLREALRTTEPLTLATQGSDDARDANSIRCVSGKASEFIAAYDGISVGRMILESEESSNTEGKCESGGARLVLTCLDSGLSIDQVSCGQEHSLFLTRHGTVLSCGSGSRGQLGHGSLEGEEIPRAVSALEGLRCVCVSSGGWHSAVISDCGDLYMWGWNECGQLGLPCPALENSHNHQHHHDQQDSELAKQLLLEERRETKAASLHLWPHCVDVVDVGCGSLEENAVIKVACGTRHTAVLTEKGEAFSTGWNKYGQLGLPHTDSLDCFSRITFSGTKKATVTKLWCGAWNSVFVLKEI